MQALSTPITLQTVAKVATVAFEQYAYEADDNDGEVGCGRCGRAGECRVYWLSVPNGLGGVDTPEVLCKADALEYLNLWLLGQAYDLPDEDDPASYLQADDLAAPDL